MLPVALMPISLCGVRASNAGALTFDSNGTNDADSGPPLAAAVRGLTLRGPPAQQSDAEDDEDGAGAGPEEPGADDERVGGGVEDDDTDVEAGVSADRGEPDDGGGAFVF